MNPKLDFGKRALHFGFVIAIVFGLSASLSLATPSPFAGPGQGEEEFRGGGDRPHPFVDRISPIFDRLNRLAEGSHAGMDRFSGEQGESNTPPPRRPRPERRRTNQRPASGTPGQISPAF